MSHAPLAPSAASRWLACPGSVPANAGQDGENEYSAEGTFAHEIAAACLEDGTDAVQRFGESKTTDVGTFMVGDEMVDGVQLYLDAVRSLLLTNDPADLFIEERVELCDDVWGTADAVVAGARHVDVVDLKYGAGIGVEPHDNPQLMIYGMAAVVTLGLSNVETVGLHIVQPRHHRSPKWRSVVVPYTDLVEWYRKTLWPGAERVRGGDDTRVAGDHCRFCAAKATCPALRDEALTAAAAVFEDNTVDLAPAVKPPDPLVLTDDELGRALTAFPMVEAWIKAVREVAYDRANKGQVPTGHKLIQKTGNRRWIDEKAAEVALTAAGINPHADPKVVSPAQAEKRLGRAKAGIVDGTKNRPGLAYKPTTGTALVPQSDSRPEFNPAAVFDQVQDS